MGFVKGQKIIFITGTPGTGKSALGKKLSRSLTFNYVDVNELIRANKWHEGYDHSKRTYIVDEKKASQKLSLLLRKNPENTVIDTHLTGMIDPKYVDVCIITSCDLKKLSQRLTKRGYSKKKIRDNIDAEIFEVCRIEAMKRFRKTIMYDSSSAFAESFRSILKKVKKLII